MSYRRAVVPTMNNQNPEVTREGITERLVCKADDPATVEEIVHAGFNADSHSGGLAFVVIGVCPFSPTAVLLTIRLIRQPG